MRPLALVLLVLAGAPLFSRGRAPVVTGSTGPALSARECQGCHEREYQEWAGSRHAQAWSNALFTESFRESGSPWCVNCHAPLAEQRSQHFLGEGGPPGLLEEGVTCAACHLRDGVILTGREPSQAAQEVHPVRLERELGTAEFCGGCHEFPLPEVSASVGPAPHLLMQQTLTEWRASRAARRGERCQSCHMAGGSHAFPGGHALEWVRGALELTWQWRGRSRVCAVVRSRNAGHAVPTGDLFRRLRLRLCEDATCERPIHQRMMSRRITGLGGSALESVDTRLPPPTASESSERTECFELDRGVAAPAHWMLELLYAEPRLESHLPDSVTRAVISSGPLSQGPSAEEPLRPH